MKGKQITKLAFVLSVILLGVWLAMGTTSSLAWFHDEDAVVNSLYFGDLKIGLYHRENGDYSPVDSTTKVFQDEALYEPGYTQLVYLRVTNEGDVPFTYELSVIPDLSTLVLGTNEKGETIDLTEYLRFGVIYAASDDELLEKTANRDLARACATTPLSTYSEDRGRLEPGQSEYASLVIFMPEEVDNAANYRGDVAPSVEVGISALAKQIGYQD